MRAHVARHLPALDNSLALFRNEGVCGNFLAARLIQAKPTKRRWRASSRRSSRSAQFFLSPVLPSSCESTHLSEQVRCRVLDFVAVGTDDRVELHCYFVDMIDVPVLAEHSAFQWVRSSFRMRDLRHFYPFARRCQDAPNGRERGRHGRGMFTIEMARKEQRGEGGEAQQSARLPRNLAVA